MKFSPKPCRGIDFNHTVILVQYLIHISLITIKNSKHFKCHLDKGSQRI